VTGSRSADLEAQVRAALATPADIAVIIIGTNDVTHKVPSHRAVPKLGAAVRALRAAGVDVVVGTCPDLGAVPPIPPPLRWVARRRSREMAVAQAVAVRVAGGVAVPLGELLGPLFCRDRSMFCHDRFHPSSAGYREVAGALVPAVLAAAHTRKAGTGAAGVAPTSVGA
jgi:lysophospholipase L1-like esterase